MQKEISGEFEAYDELSKDVLTEEIDLPPETTQQIKTEVKRELSKSVVHKTSDPVIQVSSKGQVETVNEAAIALAQALGPNFGEVFEAKALRKIFVAPDGKSKANGWYRMECADRKFEFKLLTLTESGHLLIMGNDVTMAGRNGGMSHLGFVDPLTGLATRGLFLDRVGRALRRAYKSGDRTVALISLNIIGFKQFNELERRGNSKLSTGDRVLETVADRFDQAAFPGDLVAHLGGDTFAILLEGPTVPESGLPVPDRAKSTIHRLDELFREPILIGPEQSIGVSRRVGFVVCRPDDLEESPLTVQQLLDRAETAMTAHGQVHESGPAVQYDDRMREKDYEQRKLKQDLAKAVDERQFIAFFQPIVRHPMFYEAGEVRPGYFMGELEGFESLVRWCRNGKILSPGAFLEAAEKHKLLASISWQMLESSCRQAKHLFTRFGRPCYVSVNFLPSQFAEPRMVERVIETLDLAGLPPGLLRIEVTEGMIMTDQSCFEALQELRSLGVRIMMDDFGTGHASFSRLQELPCDTVKIDKSFVDAMKDMSGLLVMKGMIELVDALGKTVVVEGIETEDQYKKLCELRQNWFRRDGRKIDPRVQGYFVSRPLCLEDVEAFMRPLEADEARQSFSGIRIQPEKKEEAWFRRAA